MIRQYFIIPTNEGQELNYIHTFKGTLQQAKHKAEYITARLKDTFTQGSVGCIIQDQNAKEIAFLAGVPQSGTPGLGHWEKR
jgi:hypothetical protein